MTLGRARCSATRKLARMKTLVTSTLLAVAALPAMAIEEPAYEVVRRIGEDVELRRYAPYVVAEVVLQASTDDAGRQAFPILAGYIFGKNKVQQKLEMTAPVTQRAESVKLEMTAPVTQTAAPGGVRVQFVLPRSVTLATAPEPLDPRVQLREEPASLRATLRYSGTWSQANDEEHIAKLRAAVAAAGLTPEGEPVLARYNGPMTPWFLRRNEVWLALR
jgi:SOUL heme-binding protein